MKAEFSGSNRIKMNQMIYQYFVTEMKKEFKDDFSLVEDKLNDLIRDHTMKEIRLILKQEIRKIKEIHSNR